MSLIRSQLASRTKAQLLALLLMTLFMTGCSEPDYIPELFLDEPVWLATTKAPTVSTAAEVLAFWGSEKRCCENDGRQLKNAKIFYKACYMAIANNRENEDLVELCLRLMSHDMPKNVRRTIHDHYLKNYFYYEASTEKCVNCLPGDNLASVSRAYAISIGSAGNYRGAIATIHRVLNERGDEISPFVQMDLYATLAWFHKESSFTQNEFATLEAAYLGFELPEGSYGATLNNHKRLGEAIERLRELEPEDTNY